MKKETLQTLAIIVICLAACFAGCKTASVSPKRNVSTIALIKYESGMVQEIKDSFHIAKAGDSVVLIDYNELLPTGKVLNREYVWGFVNADHITPSNYSSDSLFVEFNKVVVISTKHVCIDSNHKICDGNCICDGMQCPKQ